MQLPSNLHRDYQKSSPEGELVRYWKFGSSCLDSYRFSELSTCLAFNLTWVRLCVFSVVLLVLVVAKTVNHINKLRSKFCKKTLHKIIGLR